MWMKGLAIDFVAYKGEYSARDFVLGGGRKLADGVKGLIE
jgi:hypothetical protein